MTPYVVVLPGGERKTCQTLTEAAQLVADARDAGDMGSAEFYLTPRVGEVVRGGSVCARVSYNGRVWDRSNVEIAT